MPAPDEDRELPESTALADLDDDQENDVQAHAELDDDAADLPWCIACSD